MTAKEMFEELNFKYEFNENSEQICIYNEDNDKWLWVYLDRKTFYFYDDYIE